MQITSGVVNEPLDLKVKQYGFSGAVKCLILYFFENDVSANNMTDRGSVDQLRGNSLFINGHIGSEAKYLINIDKGKINVKAILCTIGCCFFRTKNHFCHFYFLAGNDQFSVSRSQLLTWFGRQRVARSPSEWNDKSWD